jgi:hypothetical protein
MKGYSLTVRIHVLANVIFLSSHEPMSDTKDFRNISIIGHASSHISHSMPRFRRATGFFSPKGVTHCMNKHNIKSLVCPDCKELPALFSPKQTCWHNR